MKRREFVIAGGALAASLALPARAAWPERQVRYLMAFPPGGESDIVAEPARAARSFANANWQRLQVLRRQYDPDDLFYGHFSVR